MTHRRILWSLCFASLWLSLQAGASDDSGYKIQLSDWSYGRLRKTVTSSNRVIANLLVKNVSAAPVKNVLITLLYTQSNGEKAAEPVKKTIGDFKPGESRKTEITADFVPAFDSYQITVTYDGGGKEQWFSASDAGQPQEKPSEPTKGLADLLVLGRDGGVDRGGRFNGTVHLKNNGTVDAKNVKFSLTFFNDKQQKIGEITDRLGDGTFHAGADLTVPISAPNCPRNPASYVMKITCDETPPEAADFSGVADVEFAKFSFKRDPKTQEVKVTAQVRNGFDVPVEHTSLILSFTNGAKKEVKNFSYDVPGKVEAGEVKPIEFKIPAVPAYEGFEQKISYCKIDKKGAPTAPGAPAAPAAPAESSKIETPKFKNIEDVEVIFSSASTNDDKTVALIGALRNGRSTAVKNVDITATFTLPDGKSIDGHKILSDVIKPGEERNFILKATGAAGYKEYNYKFTSIDAK